MLMLLCGFSDAIKAASFIKGRGDDGMVGKVR